MNMHTLYYSCTCECNITICQSCYGNIVRNHPCEFLTYRCPSCRLEIPAAMVAAGDADAIAEIHRADAAARMEEWDEMPPLENIPIPVTDREDVLVRRAEIDLPYRVPLRPMGGRVEFVARPQILIQPRWLPSASRRRASRNWSRAVERLNVRHLLREHLPRQMFNNDPLHLLLRTGNFSDPLTAGVCENYIHCLEYVTGQLSQFFRRLRLTPESIHLVNLG